MSTYHKRFIQSTNTMKSGRRTLSYINKYYTNYAIFTRDKGIGLFKNISFMNNINCGQTSMETTKNPDHQNLDHANWDFTDQWCHKYKMHSLSCDQGAAADIY